MNPLRALVRGFAKSILKRTIGRITGRLSKATESVAGRATKEMGDQILEGLNLIELAEIAFDFGETVFSARQSAGAASTGVYGGMLGSNKLNPGQQTLLEDYVLDANESYWENTTEPDPETYAQAMFATHYAVEQALSGTIEQAWEAGAEAGMSEIYFAVAAVSVEVARRLGEAFDANPWGTRQDYVTSTQRSQTDKWGRVAGGFRGYVGDPDTHSFQDSGALRQLSLSQALDPTEDSWPFWAKENNRLTYQYLTNNIDADTMQREREKLYEATQDNPDSKEPPSDYMPNNSGEFRMVEVDPGDPYYNPRGYMYQQYRYVPR